MSHFSKTILVALAAILVCTGAQARKIYVASDNCIIDATTNEVLAIWENEFIKVKSMDFDDSGNFYFLRSYQFSDAYSSSYWRYSIIKNFDEANPYKEYNTYGDKPKWHYISLAMRIKGNDVITAGTASYFYNEYGRVSYMFFQKNGKTLYKTDNEKKSLEKDSFRAYAWFKRSGIHIVPMDYDYNMEVTNRSYVYYVKDVDYLNGTIYATGWGERENNEYFAGYGRVYYVRRCPRVWANAATVLKQAENENGAGSSIHVFNPSGYAKPIVLTSGHKEGKPYAWNGESVSWGGREDGEFVKEAVISYSNGHFVRAFVTKDGRLNFHSDIVPTGLMGGPKQNKNWIFLDVVEHEGDIYALIYGRGANPTYSVVKFKGDDLLKGEFSSAFGVTNNIKGIDLKHLAIH